MVERSDPDSRIVCRSDKGITGSEAGADHTEIAVTLLLEPVEAATDIDDALTNRVESAADVGGDRIVGTLDLRGHANVVIRHAHAEDRDAHQIENAAETNVRKGVGIPVRKQYDRAPSWSRKPTGVHDVVFRIGRLHGRCEPQEFRVRSLYFGFEFGIGHFAG